eukprot:10715606-Heterocapsa_arctica.AAC.1
MLQTVAGQKDRKDDVGASNEFRVSTHSLHRRTADMERERRVRRPFCAPAKPAKRGNGKGSPWGRPVK